MALGQSRQNGCGRCIGALPSKRHSAKRVAWWYTHTLAGGYIVALMRGNPAFCRRFFTQEHLVKAEVLFNSVNMHLIFHQFFALKLFPWFFLG